MSSRKMNWYNWFFKRQRLYISVFPYVMKLGIKSRSFAFFLAVNPGVKNSGFVNSSKFSILKQIPTEYLPSQEFIEFGESKTKILERIRNNPGLGFPLIVKPDIGERGAGVRKVISEEELIQAIEEMNQNLIIQEFIDKKYEMCILYYRIPGEANGTITSIGMKEFLTVQGDGISTIDELVRSDKKLSDLINLEKYFMEHPESIGRIVRKNTVFKLTYVASRREGILFRNYNYLHSKEMDMFFDMLTSEINEFYYGRYDIKIDDFASLESGSGLKIIEINGVNGQPIHAYDHSCFTANQRTQIMKYHWDIIYKISKINKKRFKIKTGFWYLMKETIKHIKVFSVR